MLQFISMIIRYIIFVPLSIFANIQNYFTAPIIVLFAKENEKGEAWLPSWLSWWQSPDNSLDGDYGWITEHRWWKNDSDVDTHKIKKYVNRVRWLYRNSMHGFDNKVLGVVLPNDKSQLKYWYKGNQKTSNRPLNNGTIFRLIKVNNKYYFQFYFVKLYKRFKNKCIRINLGWKIWANPKENQLCQFVISINPFMGTD